MKKVSITLLSVAIIAFASCKNDTKDSNKEVEKEVDKVEVKVADEVKPAPKSLSIELEARSGSNASGKVGIVENEGQVTFEAEIYGLDEGTHAIHLHEKADCSSEDGKSSGGHWNPTFEPHGKWGATEGYHKGDIGNFEVGADGKGQVTFTTDQWCIGCGDEKKDILGKGIIVHQGADDFTSQPSGAAGARISCGGVIE